MRKHPACRCPIAGVVPDRYIQLPEEFMSEVGLPGEITIRRGVFSTFLCSTEQAFWEILDEIEGRNTEQGRRMWRHIVATAKTVHVDQSGELKLPGYFDYGEMALSTEAVVVKMPGNLVVWPPERYRTAVATEPGWKLKGLV